MTKIILLWTALLWMTFGPVSGQTRGDRLLGKWVSEDRTKTVEIAVKNGRYAAKMIESNIKGEIGMLILWDLKYDSNTEEWADGKVQLPGMSHSASCYARLDGNKLTVTGYHGIRLFGSSQTYTRKN